MVRLGLTLLLEDRLELVAGKSLGLITNSTGVNENLESNISLFYKHPDIQLKAIFSPEHGLWGAAQDAIRVASFQYLDTSIPVFSLYGDTKKPTPEMLKGLDILVFDIQDVGTRFYTYISTMAMAMETCVQNHIGFMVLDRPNPINGLNVEGNIPEPEFRSFVGYLPIPIRHGKTVGELAQFYNDRFKLGAQLTVVGMSGWNRDMWFNDTGLQWVMTSPNMPTLDTAIVYPGLCLIEGTNVSEGRGTTKPFEIIGAPWINGIFLADRLNDLSIPGVKFRPVNFIPTFSKYKDQNCGGVQVHVLDRDKFLPVRTGLSIIDKIKRIYYKEFQWHGAKTPFFDLLMGTDKTRKQLSDGESVDNIIYSWNKGVDQ